MLSFLLRPCRNLPLITKTVTRALLRLERTMNLFGGRGEGRGLGRDGREWGEEEGREGRGKGGVGSGGEGGRGGRDDCYTYSNRFVQ